MKKFLVLLFSIFICYIAHADTETINWYVDGDTYATNTCTTGGDIELPNTPAKYGYTFQGWSTEYIPIEYLESTGTQYIDTGFKFDGKIKIVFKANWDSSVGSGVLFGANSTTGTGEQFFRISKYCLMGQCANFTQEIKLNEDVLVEMQIYTGNAYLKINSIQTPTYNGTKTNNLPVYMFADTSYGNISTTNMKFYYFQIYNKDSLVCDMIPVVDKNNIPCMYDKVSHTYFYNQGTGDFIAGPVIVGQ